MYLPSYLLTTTSQLYIIDTNLFFSTCGPLITAEEVNLRVIFNGYHYHCRIHESHISIVLDKEVCWIYLSLPDCVHISEIWPLILYTTFQMLESQVSSYSTIIVKKDIIYHLIEMVCQIISLFDLKSWLIMERLIKIQMLGHHHSDKYYRKEPH